MDPQARSDTGPEPLLPESGPVGRTTLKAGARTSALEERGLYCPEITYSPQLRQQARVPSLQFTLYRGEGLADPAQSAPWVEFPSPQ